MAQLRHFSKVINKLNLDVASPVAVAVSGGCDSLALTLLSKKVFSRVVGITLNHRLREESRHEAAHVGELVQNLGVEHRTVTLDWGPEGIPRKGRIQQLAREKRYETLLGICKEMSIDTLLVGHHQDDQNETFIMRLCFGSGITGLGCMYPVSHWPGYPATKIVRPLLEWSKKDLAEVCRSEGIEWVEDPSNKSSYYMRNVIRATLEKHPEVSSGLPQLVASCNEARSIIHQRVNSATLSLPMYDTEMGCVYVNVDDLKALPNHVSTRVLLLIGQYVSGKRTMYHYKSLQRIIRALPLKATYTMNDNNNIVPIGKKILCFGQGSPERAKQTSTPIQIGEPLLWDNRWLITLTSPPWTKLPENVSFKVRHFNNKEDMQLSRLGIRKIRSRKLPHLHIRGGFPVIVDGKGRVVVIPYLKIHTRLYDVRCTVEFQPRYRLEELLMNYKSE